MAALALVTLCQFGDEPSVEYDATATIRQFISELGMGKKKGKEAADKLQKIGKPAVPALVSALQAKGVNENQTLMIRYYASAALSFTDDERAVKALYGVLKDPAQHDWVKRNAAYAMGMAEFGPAAPWLAKLARGTTDGVLRTRCILALALLEDREGENYMREEGDAFLIELLLQDPDHKMRIAAARSLGDRRVVGAVDALAAALSDEDYRVASNAALALAKLKEKGWTALGLLMDTLDRKEKILRNNVRGALINITGKRLTSEARWKRWWKKSGRKAWREKLKEESAPEGGEPSEQTEPR